MIKINTEASDSVAGRLAALRTLNGFSLEELALRSGLTKSYISKLERGLSQPSIATVLKLSRAFGVSADKLLSETPQDDQIVLVRNNERVPFSRVKGRSGYSYEAIAAHRTDKSMTPFVMRPPLSTGAKLDLVTHAGEELVYVIHGQMEIVFADRKFTMKAGDSIYFNASIPHRSRSLGKMPAEALVVVSAATPHHLLGNRCAKITAT
jgi:transcriptional regulator with XRE-family HTH domain